MSTAAPPSTPTTPSKPTITNPRLVVEVLSESTESYDRGGKFDLYRQIPGLQEYVLISQQEPLAETFLRQTDGAWLFNAWKGMENSVQLRSLEITLPLAEIYSGIDFQSPGA